MFGTDAPEKILKIDPSKLAKNALPRNQIRLNGRTKLINPCDFIQFYIILYIRDFIFLINLAKMYPLQCRVCMELDMLLGFAIWLC